MEKFDEKFESRREKMKFDLEKILKEVRSYRERKATLDPQHAALLVIDIQNYFDRIIQPILGNILKVIQASRQKGIPILFTQHGHTDPVSDGGMLGKWWGQVIAEGTEDWQLLSEITIGAKDAIIPKKRYSAFFETDLEAILRSKGIRDLIIAGVMTNFCCETTARDAFVRDYRVFFLVDGTATGRSELHVATLKNLGFGFAYLITCEELIRQTQSG